MSAEVKIEGKTLVVRIPINDPPAISASGKSLVLASTNGNQPTAAVFQGKPIVLGLNAYVKNR